MRAITRLAPLILLAAIGGVAGCGDSEPRGAQPATTTEPAPATPAFLAQGSDVAGWIEVAAFGADGEPAINAIAYAVRVGRVSTRRQPDWPLASVDAAGNARIPVPAVGTYDVGVVYPSRAQPRTIATDVRVLHGAATRVALRMPALAPVEISVPEVDRDKVWIYAEEASQPGSRVSQLPTRGEHTDARWSFRAGTVQLPEGVPYKLFIQEQDEQGGWKSMMEGWEVSPAVVRAPGRVTFRRNAAPAPELEVPVRFKVTGIVPPELRRSDMRTRYAEGTDDAQILDGRIEWKDGAPEEGSLTIIPGAKPARLTWSGDGVLPGEVLLPGATEGKAVFPSIEIAIRADDLPLVEGVDVVSGRIPPRKDSPRLHATGPDPDADVGFGYWTDEDRSSDLRPGWKTIVEWGAWWVSRPVTVPKRGRLKFDLVPGGYLLATSPRVVTPGLGSLTIRRADGAWLGERNSSEIESDACDGQSAETARPGMILGPFPEGDVELIVLLGGEERARIVGRVKANQITPFPLTW